MNSVVAVNSGASGANTTGSDVANTAGGDVAIIGAGPVGIFSVFACGQLGLSCQVFDCLTECGGQCTALYPQKPIYDIPAYPEISGEELVEKLMAQVAPFKPKYHLGKTIGKIIQTPNGFEVATLKDPTAENTSQSDPTAQSDSTEGKASTEKSPTGNLVAENPTTENTSQGDPTAQSEPTKENSTATGKNQNKTETSPTFKAVIIAGGIGRFAPNRPPLAGITQFENHSLFYQVSSREAFRDQQVVIFGGGDSAVDWCIELAKLAAKIYLVHRRPKFRAMPASLDKLAKLIKAQKVETIIGYQPTRLEATASNRSQLRSVTLSHITTKQTKTISVDKMLVFYGLRNDTELFEQWGLATEEGGFAVDHTMATTRKGIFAVGDAARYKAKLKLILSGFSEAAIAAEAIYKHINGTAPRFQYSTTKGKPTL